MITAQDIQDMVRHWLNTPVNGYLGSGYGADLPSLLQKELTANVADSFLAKLKTDIPIIGEMPADQVNLHSRPNGVDGLEIFIEVAGTFIQLDSGEVRTKNV
jgi:hypothetical protein